MVHVAQAEEENGPGKNRKKKSAPVKINFMFGDSGELILFSVPLCSRVHKYDSTIQ